MNLSPLHLEQQPPPERQQTTPPGNQLPNMFLHHQESSNSNLRWSRNAQNGLRNTKREPSKKEKRVMKSTPFSPPREKGLMSSKLLLSHLSPFSTNTMSRWQQPSREEGQGRVERGVIEHPLVHRVQT